MAERFGRPSLERPREAPVSRDLVQKYWMAVERNDGETLGRLRHPEWIAEWPQSGERIRGHENDRAIHEQYPGYPRHELRQFEGGPGDRWALSPLGPVRIAGTSNLWLIEALYEYPNGERFHVLRILELEDALVRRQTDYWASPFHAPEWRARWVERYEDASSAAEGWRGVGSVDEDVHRAAIELHLRGVAAGDLPGAVHGFVHEDCVVEWPQSGERVRGVANYLTILEHDPTRASLTPRRVTGVDDLFVLEVLLDRAGAPSFGASILRFRGARVAVRTDYLAEPFEAPGWRARWVERM